MSLYGADWNYDDIKIIGTSLAGIRTCLLLPELEIAFDVAQGLPFALKAKHFFISHCHMDHASGIPYLISLKTLNQHMPPNFYLPESLVEPMQEILRIWQKTEGHTYNFNFFTVRSDSRFDISARHVVRPFTTVHRVPSFGYTVFEKKKHLIPSLGNASREEIIERRKQNLPVEEMIEEPIFTFTGDTQIEFVHQAPWIKQSRVLAMECTYYDSKRSTEQARKWGHIHLDELIPLLPELMCERILLIHRSSRYSLAEAEALVRARTNDSRVCLFPENRQLKI